MYSRKWSKALLGLTAVLLASCANQYERFYQPVAGATPEAIAQIREAPPPGNPQVEHASAPTGPQEMEALLSSYIKRGYALIGSSSFDSTAAQRETSAIEQARKVGADLVVILAPRYAGSTTAVMPIATPTSSTSYSTATATAYGPGGVANVYGSGTTTTYGTSTSYVPITLQHFDYGAGYFIKRKWRFGVLCRDLTDAERQELQTNKGAFVRVVVDASPAFIADILPGDIILAIDGQPVINQAQMFKSLEKRGGQTISVSLYRHGSRIEKSVQLAP